MVYNNFLFVELNNHGIIKRVKKMAEHITYAIDHKSKI